MNKLKQSNDESNCMGKGDIMLFHTKAIARSLVLEKEYGSLQDYCFILIPHQSKSSSFVLIFLI